MGSLSTGDVEPTADRNFRTEGMARGNQIIQANKKASSLPENAEKANSQIHWDFKLTLPEEARGKVPRGPNLKVKQEIIKEFLRKPNVRYGTHVDENMRQRMRVKLRNERLNKYASDPSRKARITRDIIASLIPGISVENASIDYKLKIFFIIYLLILVPATVLLIGSIPTNWYNNCHVQVGEPFIIKLLLGPPPNLIQKSRFHNPATQTEQRYNLEDELHKCKAQPMRCEFVNQTELTYDQSMLYTLVCFCTKIQCMASFWDTGLDTSYPVDSYNNDPKNTNKVVTDSVPIARGLVTKVKNVPFVCGVAFIIISIFCIVSLIAVFYALKINPYLRMNLTFHLILAILTTTDFVFASAGVLSAMRIRKDLCESMRLPFYLAILASILLFICWFVSIIMAGFAGRLRQEEFNRKRLKMLEEDRCKKLDENRRMRANQRRRFFKRGSFISDATALDLISHSRSSRPFSNKSTVSSIGSQSTENSGNNLRRRFSFTRDRKISERTEITHSSNDSSYAASPSS